MFFMDFATGMIHTEPIVEPSQPVPDTFCEECGHGSLEWNESVGWFICPKGCENKEG